MTNSRLLFLKNAFSEYKIEFSEDCTNAVIFNPFYDENFTVYYYEEDDFTPFCVSFSFQHCHLTDEEDTVDWINEIITGKKLVIEFFQNEQRCFGSDIDAEELRELSYTKLEQFTGYYGLTKLLKIADSFKVRGWDIAHNFDAEFVHEADGSFSIKKL